MSPATARGASADGIARAGPTLVERAGQRADLWLAVLAGPAPWLDPDRRPSGPETAAVALEATALATAISWAALDVFDQPSWGRALRQLAILVALAATLAFLAYPALLWVTRGRVPLPRLWARPRLAAAIRSIAVVLAVALWIVLAPSAIVVAAWPLGVAAACEVALTVASIGMSAHPLLWWKRFLISGPHVGSAMALIGLVAADLGDRPTRLALALYASLHVVVAVTVVVIALLESLRGRFDSDLEARESRTVEIEHRRRAHWLHDEVCTRLGFVQRQVESGQLGSHEVAAEIRRLDHHLRERQLDELLSTGTVELAEVVQPYLRMAQQQGVRLTAVPGFGDAARVLPEAKARLAQRMLANAVGNAVKAGATELAIRVRFDGPVLELEVEDDAGGFDAAAIQPGRGLDRLRNELGPDNLRIDRTEKGTRISATVPLEDRPARAAT